MIMCVSVRHWLPILTFCPVNNLPDLVYVTVHFLLDSEETAPELYAVRKRIRKLISGRKAFMEDLAKEIAYEFPNACSVDVRLAFNRHCVEVTQ